MSPSAADRPWFVFAGGGTGGHLYPALAIASELRTLRPDVRVSFFCTDRPIDRRILDAAGFESLPQTVRPFSTRPWRWPGFLTAWRGAIRRCVAEFRTMRPAVVIGGGGYGSDPPVRAAMRLGIPTAILNPDLVPGRANRALAQRVDRVFAQWAGTQRYLGDVPGFRAWGCPVRPAFGRADRADGVRRFGLDPDRRSLLVTGASQGARTINEAMIALAPRLAEVDGWQVLHLAGSADVDRVRIAYAAAGMAAEVLSFTDHMAEAMVAADLAVSRAGASTLAELTAAALPSVLLPYPFHRDQHQLHNAEVLRDAGAAVIVPDRIDVVANAPALADALLGLMAEPDRLAAMATAARNLARPCAAFDLATELLVLAGLENPVKSFHGPGSRKSANTAYTAP
ncbi:MAG: UDP-N-acetylglucosamine--N-acetylmuramyl-(pentapeptide) pyrophosphoryl-undecaprenol N-acetylglucosamine transferase [Phycisphaerae bacterium]|nr:UDP-N-acetylglucosamine--N-acetylmuramyl-(pentapeptide) pyrophosphoryl-undecaprenol N-acetylglucosamine transferase [Phycisphaerae bacterium]